MEKYLKDLRNNVNAVTRLSTKQELELATAARSGDVSARNKLIEHNLPFAIQQAKRLNITNLELEELVSAANYGLIRAADSFDPSYGVRFITYAVHKIKAELHTTMNSRFLVHTPGGNDRCYSQSIDRSYDDDGSYVSDTFASDERSIDDICILNDYSTRIRESIQQLDKRSRDIMNAYFNIYDYDTKPTEVAAKYNLSGERVRRIKNDTLELLRTQLC